MNNDGAKGNIQINASQTPGEGTCDPAAQVIAASHKSETFDTQINLAFSHVTAYGNLSIGLPEGAGAVSNISLTGSENIAGRFYYDFNGALSENSASSTISLLTSKVSDIFFACAPADLSGGKLDITVTTNNGTYEKSIDLTGKTLKFESGKISKFTVNGFTKKESDEVYTLVTDASTLKIGDKIIIAAATADFAISTTQNSNNRAQAAVTKTNNTIVNPGADVQLFTLETGTKVGTYAFNTGSGYIYAASSSRNYLKTQQTKNDNGSWTISCKAEGVATITAQGNNTRNLLKYNIDNNPGLFSCYETGQSDVAIYSDGKGTGSVPTPPVIKAEKTSVSLNHNDETNYYMTISITGADAADITCKVSENADGTGEVAWLTANYPDKDGKLSYMAEANTTDAARTAYIILTARNADGATSLAIKVTQNGVGAEPKSYEWDLTSESNDWTANGCEKYFAQPYGIKKANAYIVNKSISDFANASKISVSVKSLCNGATTSKLTVYLVDATGEAIGDGQVIIPDNISNASKTTYKEVIFNSVDSKVTGLMIKCTTFDKNVLINGVKYTVNY